MSDTELGTLIEDSGAVMTGKFKLSDGSLTDYYIDKYVFETKPDILSIITDEIVDQIDEDEIDVVVGPALGAVPLVTAVSLEARIPAAYIRMGEKHRGTQARVEGTIEKGMRVAVLEDVTSTGNTILETAKLVEEIGGLVEQLITVVDRNAGAVEHIRDEGYELDFLTRVGEDFQV
ncbi:orotate phosphoribosyltransferase [Natrarchaeobius halalkaliphilus]|uniref:Orotate phosphoribosyltransferase n=1 Tax=Natrarchaeobius halalkaliphilus TaxID=1679091 RepID=A0A3N6LZA5_9EURY|nr:orotate phosphoribosyltransferase [Natrarchaeobius halalkaliphilus]RQG88073.1 orotate phosphoribosyltransferase [Natrarchaeobius halalkaliphilus]